MAKYKDHFEKIFQTVKPIAETAVKNHNNRFIYFENYRKFIIDLQFVQNLKEGKFRSLQIKLYKDNFLLIKELSTEPKDLVLFSNTEENLVILRDCKGEVPDQILNTSKEEYIKGYVQEFVTASLALVK